jgi:uncharacterized protein YlxW (UPF0749 family)
MKVKGKHVILSFVLVVLGFLISFSYQLTNDGEENRDAVTEWQKEYELRDELISQEEKTKALQQELQEKQGKIREVESLLAQEEKMFFNLIEDVEKLRMFAGVTKVQGSGVEVTLADANYISSEQNANSYIVHEIHIHKVINELLASGAKAIAINGQRLLHNSYISCIGPVISVDGNEYAAPFIITAIGDTEVLSSALNLPQGVKYQLVSENIEVKIEKKQQILLEPYLGVSDEQI